MKIARPRISKLDTGSARQGAYGHGRAQNAGQIKSGHHHLSINSGAAAPGWIASGPKKKSSRRMY